MADIVSSEQRSRNMAAIHSRDTRPEIFFRHLLFADGYRYRIAVKYILGHPDMFLRKYNTAIFIHGCFWHQHRGCRYAYTPKSRQDFWEKKFQRNICRDREVRRKLEETHIKCLIIWECAVRKMRKDETYRQKVLLETECFLNSNQPYMEIQPEKMEK